MRQSTIFLPLDREQLDRAFVRTPKGGKLPVQDHVAAVESNPDFTTQNTRVSDLQRDTLSESSGDASDCDLSEDGDVQDHGKRDTQVDRVIGDNDLLGIFDEQ